MNTNKQIAVLVPCYNEETTIRKVVDDFQKALPNADVYVYNNNSTDRTEEIAADAGALVRRVSQQGKGNVVRMMFADVEADCYIMVDGDDTYPAGEAPEMVRLVLEEGADMVVGDRLSATYFQENKRLFHNFGNDLVRKSVNILFHADISDIMTGYRAFSRVFVKTYPVLSQGFEIETDMSIHAIDKRLNIRNHVIEYRDRCEGSESKLNTYSDGFKVLMTIIRLFRLYKPFEFFSIFALLLLVIAICFFIPVLLEYLKTGLVQEFPTLIVCGFTVIAALLSYFTGMTLHSIAQIARHDFENQFKLVKMWPRQ